MSPHDLTKAMSVPEAAAWFGVCPATMRRKMKDGEVKWFPKSRHCPQKMTTLEYLIEARARLTNGGEPEAVAESGWDALQRARRERDERMNQTRERQ